LLPESPRRSSWQPPQQRRFALLEAHPRLLLTSRARIPRPSRGSPAISRAVAGQSPANRRAPTCQQSQRRLRTPGPGGSASLRGPRPAADTRTSAGRRGYRRDSSPWLGLPGTLRAACTRSSRCGARATSDSRYAGPYCYKSPPPGGIDRLARPRVRALGPFIKAEPRRFCPIHFHRASAPLCLACGRRALINIVAKDCARTCLETCIWPAAPGRVRAYQPPGSSPSSPESGPRSPRPAPPTSWGGCRRPGTAFDRLPWGRLTPTPSSA
jgi:hypothetical protein